MSRYQTPYLQYFDAAGKPLAGGKLFFYEAGTNDTKSVYTDSELSIPATNPVTLNSNGSVSNIFYAGLARVVLKNSTGTQVFDIDNVGPEDLSGLPPLYVSDSTYSLNDVVKTADGLYYRSTQNGNAGNTPSITSEYWEKIDFLYTYNPNTGYQVDDVVKHDGQLYISTIAANLGNDPSTSNNWRKLTVLAEFEYLSGGLTLNKVSYPVGTKANVKSFSASTGGRNSYWVKQAVTGPASQLPSERLDLQCTDATGAVWSLQHSGTVFISSIGGDEGADNGLVFRAYDTKADYLDLEGKTWPCTSLNTDNGAGREILQAKVFNGKLVVTNSLNGETNVQEFAPFLESEIQLSETKSPIVDWDGLNVLWLGTSIPHQGVGVDGYPERLAEKLNFTVQNWAWSGSHAFYDIDGDAFDSGTVRALSMTETDRLAGLALYGTSSAYDDSFDIVTKASEMTTEYRIKRQFESGAIDCVVLDHNHNDRKNIAAYESNDKTINAVVKGTTTTFTLDDVGGLFEGDGCYVRVEGIGELDYAAGRITGIVGTQVTVAIDSSGMSGTLSSGTFKYVDRGTVNGAFDFLIAYTKNMGIRYGQEGVKIILCGAPSYFTNDVNRDHAIWSVNRSIKDIADEWQLPFFDVANALRLTYRDHLTYLPDEVHPSTGETRAVFTNIWAEWLNGGAANFYNPEEVLQRNKAINNVTNQPALYSKYDESFATRSTIYTEDDELINDDFTGGLTDWTELGTGAASVIGAPWGTGSAVQFDVLADNTAPYIRQDVAVGEAPVLEFDFYMPNVDVATGVTQQTTIASINSSGGAGYSVGIIQTVGGVTQLRATYNKGGFGLAPVVPLPGATVTIANTTKYRIKLDVVDGYIFFSVDGDILYAGAIDNSLIGAATSVLVGPTFTNMSSAYSLFISNVVAGAKSEQHVMTTEELQKTVQSYTLAELQGMSPTLTGRRAICSDRADAPLMLMEDGYTAIAGDITAANGRIWALQIDAEINAGWFGIVADCNGVTGTDNSQAILDCISKAKDTSRDISIPRGYYYVDAARLDIESAMTIKGAGIDNTVIFFGGSPEKSTETRIKWQSPYNTGDYTTSADDDVAYAIKITKRGVKISDLSIATATQYSGYSTPWDSSTDAPTSNYDYGIMVNEPENVFHNVNVYGVWSRMGLILNGTMGAFGDSFSAYDCLFSGRWGAGVVGAEGEPVSGEEYLDLVSADIRTGGGMSDLNFIRCGFSSTFATLKTRLNIDGSNRRVRLASDDAGALYINGQLSKNAAKRIQGMRFFNCRMSGAEIYNYYINYANRVEFIGCHTDANTDALDVDGGSLSISDFAHRVTENARNIKYIGGNTSAENDERARLTPDGERVYSEFGYGDTESGKSTLSADELSDKGSFTPELSASSGSATYSVQSGSWVKIGNLVKIWGRIDVTSIGDLSGSITIPLPFTASSEYSYTFPATFGSLKNIQLIDGLAGYVNAGSSDLTLVRYTTDASVNVFNQTDLTDGARIDFFVEVLI
ncbi:putative tailspike protein [Pseudoalteromonas virus vB_PspP-H6/1]|nr:putative tailspike protein [Pseudoalteromonas virus vB_PspP-H6/1]